MNSTTLQTIVAKSLPALLGESLIIVNSMKTFARVRAVLLNEVVKEVKVEIVTFV